MKFNWLSMVVFSVVWIAGCSSPPTQQSPSQAQAPTEEFQERPANASNYAQDLIYPRETEYFVTDGELSVHNDPFYGAALRYVDKRDYPDIITVLFYPIPTTHWDNAELILNGEIEAFIAEIDNTVKMGIYQSRKPEVLSDYSFTKNGRTYNGKKIHYEFTNQQGNEFNADTYIFMQKDKIITIRTSSSKDFTPDWNGDLITNELLPEFTVPDESEYMRALREKYRRNPQL